MGLLTRICDKKNQYWVGQTKVVDSVKSIHESTQVFTFVQIKQAKKTNSIEDQ